jgi:hypothetical protein
MRAFYDRLTGRYLYTGRRRAGLERSPVRTCQHGLVVCACMPSLPPPQDPWLLTADTIFLPEVNR